ncbi:MAG: response regulator [Nocardioidaceae bacterium]
MQESVDDAVGMSDQAGGHTKAKILLVDDRPDNLLALSAVLSSLDHTLVNAHSGEEALKALLGDEFALVILDAQMPGMDGYATAAHIKRRERTRSVPIIFLTATYSDSQDAFRGYAAGAVDYITKPFDPWVLRAKVNVFVDLYLKNRQLGDQAALLRRTLFGAPNSRIASQQLMTELTSRVRVVEDHVAALREQTSGQDPAAAGPQVADGLRVLDEKVARLRQALDALDSS